MVKHNNQIPNRHFKKKWQFHVKTWFNQPARKARRQLARSIKAERSFPRPKAGLLRPVVTSQTIKYNTKKRLGRGFTFGELKEAGIPRRRARSIGISVDHRRRNRSLESLQDNANRLKAYKAMLVVFPRKSKKPKAGDASSEELQAVSQHGGAIIPIEEKSRELQTTSLTEEHTSFNAYQKLRIERQNARLVGVRAKRAAEAAAEEKDRVK